MGHTSSRAPATSRLGRHDRVTLARAGKLILRRLCLCMAVGLGLSSCSASDSTSSPAAPEVGINSDITWGVPSADVHSEIELMKYARVRWIRASVDLSGAEYFGRGRLDKHYLRPVDRAIQTARAAGLNVLMEFDRAPYWASADPALRVVRGRRRWKPYWTYRNPADYGRIVADLTKHYLPMGVHTFELWNEPNNPAFWPSGVDPAAYVPLLRAGYRAIKAVDPSATVLMGGLMPGGALGYLQGLYAAGARGFYDAANFHMYPHGDPQQCSSASFCLLDALRQTMLEHGDAAPVWITEFGWSTCTRNPCVTRRQQRAYVADTYRLLALPRYAWVSQTFIYQLRDLLNATTHADWGGGLGVVSRQLDPKPSYGALIALTSSAKPRIEGRASIALKLTHTGRQRHPRRALVTAFGWVRGYAGGQVLLVVQRWVDDGWASARVRVLPLTAAGRFRLGMRFRAGLWRVRAIYEQMFSVVEIHGYGA